MKIKRYTAASMRAALAQVRSEQGPDAVILSSRRSDDGIEVIAAVDYDEALFVEANRQRIPSTTIAPTPDSASAIPAAATAPAAAAAPAPVAASAPVATPGAVAPKSQAASVAVATSAKRPMARTAASIPAAPPSRTAAAAGPTAAAHAQTAAARAVVPAATPAVLAPAPIRTAVPAATHGSSLAMHRPDPAYGAMQRELRDLRQVLETGLAGMTWNDRRLREPLKARVLEELSAMDIAPDIAMSLAALTPRRTTLQNPSHIPLALLVKHLPVVDDLAGVSGGVMAVVGPTGAGKTTTIAKLAARWCMRHGSEDLALVSTDGYRIGARDQLMTYSRILGVPMHAADSGRDLSRVLAKLAAKKLVLIDTAGMGPRDVRLAEQLAALQLGAARARVLLALPAQGEAHALDEIVRAFAPVTPVACVLTKIDEAASLGAVMSATLRHRLKIAYICNGQRVPEDLHAAHRRRIWLVRTALALKAGRPALRDESYYARNFGRATAHA